MRALPAILAVVLAAACTGSAELPSAPSALASETMTAAIRGGNGNADRTVRVHVQVASARDGVSFFLSDVNVTIETEFGTFSGTTRRQGTATIEVAASAAGQPVTIHLSKEGYVPRTASVELSARRNQSFQFGMSPA